MKADLLSLVALPCRICGEQMPYRFTATGDRSGTRINVYFCVACNAHFTAPSEFDYEKEDDGLIAYYGAHRGCILWRHKLIFDYLEKFFGLAGEHFLDIGSGAGYSLEMAAKCGWEGQGIEPSSTLAEYSRARLCGQVIHGYFTADMRANRHRANPKGYDYLLIDNVLEHIGNPADFMKQALSLLAERGVALVAIPPVDWLRVARPKLLYTGLQ